MQKEQTDQLRQNLNMAESELSEQAAMPLDYSMATAGGKSGSGFAGMGKFVVKYGLRDGEGIIKFMDEPRVFRDLAPRLTKEWEEGRRTRESRSLLNKVFMFLELKVFGDNGEFKLEYDAVIENALYGVGAEAEAAKVPWKVFDLKGRSREGGNGDFPDLFPRLMGDDDEWGGELYLETSHCDALIKSFLLDVEHVFLPAENDIIDYSFLVGIAKIAGFKKRPEVLSLVEHCKTVGEPLCFVTTTHVITVAIIDYLNELNESKDAENILSSIKKAVLFSGTEGKFDHYHEKMLEFLGSICQPKENYMHKLKEMQEEAKIQKGKNDIVMPYDPTGVGFVY